MNPLLTKIIVIVAAVAIVVPATFLLASQYTSSQSEANPFSYVPLHSEVVAEAHLNSTAIYLFVSNGSAGAVLPFTINEIELFANATYANSSSPLQITPYTSYMSQTVYSVSNFSISSLGSSGFTINNSILAIVSQSLPGNNSTLFAANAGTAGMVIGNLGAVKDSISSAGSGNTFSSVATSYLDGTSNYSFYVKPKNLSSVNYITGNISDGHSNVYVSLSGNTSLGSFHFVKNGTYNVTVSSKPGSLMVTVTGNYTLSELVGYVTQYLGKVGA
ncbi:MAG TPA: hypothetical protein VJ944_04775 [Thermoplasmataceae archaeon]|nr:hypothetical protein [Thermoplasmataceae archaeon]